MVYLASLLLNPRFCLIFWTNQCCWKSVKKLYLTLGDCGRSFCLLSLILPWCIFRQVRGSDKEKARLIEEFICIIRLCYKDKKNRRKVQRNEKWREGGGASEKERKMKEWERREGKEESQSMRVRYWFKLPRICNFYYVGRV